MEKVLSTVGPMDTTSQDANEAQGLALNITPEQVLLSLDQGQAVSKEALASALQDAGVSVGIDEHAVSEALTLSQKGQAVIDLIIARQIDPVNCKPARLENAISMGQVAMPGDVIQRLIPGDMGQNGTSVTGDTIEAPMAPVVKLQVGDNTQEVGYELQATSYGVVKLQAGSISIVPPLTVSHDKMTASLDVYPESSVGTPTSTEVIYQCLEQFGISVGIQKQAIEEVLKKAQAEKSVVAQVVVAKGKESKAEKLADYEFLFTINGEDPQKILSGEIDEEKLEQPRILELVGEDSELCRERPAESSKAGLDVFNQEVKAPPAAKVKVKAPGCGDNVVKEGNVYKATLSKCGYVDLSGGKITVKSPVDIASDNMQATLCLYPKDTQKLALTKDMVLQLIKLGGIRFGLDDAAIDAAFEKVEQDNVRQVLEIIAKGQEEKTGEDADFNHFISVDQLAGAKKEDGTIDFRERGTIINVVAGDAIGKKIPATPGQPQVNILGETSPSKGGKDIDFQPGQHCELKDDGIFYAKDEGALMVKDGIVHVTDIYEHKGDVDLHSGNLQHKKGAIEISGSVNSGFEVKANGHIIVKENVDNGKLVAGGDVAVGAGVIQPEKSIGYIHSMGSVSVKFAQNAKILSYKDIVVAGSAMNCQINAKGKVNITKGKGCIIGGSVKSSEEIRVKQVGSEAGSLTLVEVELDPKKKKEFAEAIAEEEALVSKQLGDVDKLRGLMKEQKQFLEKIREKAAIIVEGVIYPGTTVKILGVAQVIKSEKRRCKITLSPNKTLYFGNIDS